MNKKILSIIGISLLPLSIAFADTNSQFTPSEQPLHKSPIEEAPNINSTIVEENQTSGNTNNDPSIRGDESQLPPSKMQVPDSEKNGNVGEPQQLTPSNTNTNSPTRYPDPTSSNTSQ
jgi:hypothetical protein